MNEQTSPPTTPSEPPAPLPALQRRILGVLLEKARTTPDAYPMTLNALVTGCNQKSNRHPVMNVSSEQVEDELTRMREAGLVAEVHGSGRVPKYRHHAYDYLEVKGASAGIMTELLLRGEQTLGELRSRASRFEPIADQATLHSLLADLLERHLVVELTPPGRGQLVTHNLYPVEELEAIRAEVGQGGRSGSSGATPASAPAGPVPSDELSALRDEVAQLRGEIDRLRSMVESLNAQLNS